MFCQRCISQRLSEVITRVGRHISISHAKTCPGRPRAIILRSGVLVKLLLALTTTIIIIGQSGQLVLTTLGQEQPNKVR